METMEFENASLVTGDELVAMLDGMVSDGPWGKHVRGIIRGEGVYPFKMTFSKGYLYAVRSDYTQYFLITGFGKANEIFPDNMSGYIELIGTSDDHA